MSLITEYEEYILELTTDLQILAERLRRRGLDATYRTEGPEPNTPHILIETGSLILAVLPSIDIEGEQVWPVELGTYSEYLDNVDLAFVRYPSETLDEMVDRIYPFLELLDVKPRGDAAPFDAKVSDPDAVVLWGLN